MNSWLRDNALGLVALVLEIIVSFGVISALFDSFAKMFSCFTLQFVLLVVVCVGFGFCCAYVLGLKDYMKRKSEIRREEEQQERDRENRLQEEKKEAERLRNRLFELPDSYKAILFEAVMNEVVTTSGEESVAAESLEKEGLLVKLDTRLLAGQSWKASDRARNTIHPEDHFLWTDFRDAPRQRLLKE